MWRNVCGTQQKTASLSAFPWNNNVIKLGYLTMTPTNPAPYSLIMSGLLAVGSFIYFSSSCEYHSLKQYVMATLNE